MHCIDFGGGRRIYQDLIVPSVRFNPSVDNQFERFKVYGTYSMAHTHTQVLFLFLCFLLFLFFSFSTAAIPCRADEDNMLWCKGLGVLPLADLARSMEDLDPTSVTVNPEDNTVYSEVNINLSTLFGYTPAHTRAHRALELCEDNIACAHSVLHHQALSPGHDCWVCRHVRHRFTVTPLSSNVLTHLYYEEALGPDSNCSLPHAMLMPCSYH